MGVGVASTIFRPNVFLLWPYNLSRLVESSACGPLFLIVSWLTSDNHSVKEKIVSIEYEKLERLWTHLDSIAFRKNIWIPFQ